MTIKTKINICTIALLIFSCAFAMPAPVSARTSVRMKQVIRSVPCGIDHLTDANGVDHYFAPRECGKLVVSTPLTSTGSAPVTELPGGIAPVKPVYLDTSTSVNGNAGYLLLTQKGMVYSFRLQGDNPLTSPRTFEVIKVESEMITIRFSPDGQTVALKKGERIKLDLAYDSDPDVGFVAESISPDGTVSLRVWFPLQQRMVGLVDDNTHALIASIMLFSFASLLMYMSTEVRAGRGRRWLLSHTWHALGS